MADLAAAAARAIYVGSPKHVDGFCHWKDRGRAGEGAIRVEDARGTAPEPPFTMLCPVKWNRRNPAHEATELLRDALRRGQVSAFEPGRMPRHVYARDPDDSSIVYKARLLTDDGVAYKAYPLTDAQIEGLEITVA